VRLVEDPSAHREQILQLLAADEVLGRLADPLAEGAVDLEDGPARRRDEQAAGCFVEELLRAGQLRKLFGHG
jgi:hypothetical protein